MIKIGVDIDEKLIILLKEMLDYEFINTKRESSSFEIFIIDIDTENITDKIKANYKKGIPVIVVLGKNNIKEMRTLFLSNYVADCILKHEIYEIEKSIEKLIYSKQKYTQFYLNDNQKKGIIDFSEVTYISYCRTTRRIQFHLTNKEVFTLKENFSIIEEKLETINSFYKIERGTIINTNLIRYIDYKEETIIFRDFSILYVSKIKLKKIEEDLNLTKNRLYL
ncbi:DNA-binding LytR/AlgR family response regulator [Fusobacterium sp. PH5-7]|uniref:LytTR family transcriptional regulator DNA-binding domain-containing protein n=1 Tax=Fusobacterium TaxID=848 RepID=UPI002474FEB5|nr:LytTR family transcriptional regulator DNA-binding domain-containing protein [Fusobacterium sp. PH5-7]MDH6459303.1 DNA-binding LytR/AlgR family response regulator [Fusobacterium sp. PH5-7]